MAKPTVILPRRCASLRVDGRPCRARPQEDSARCFWHDPAKAEAVAAARQLGGLHRRRAHAVAAAYELHGLDTVTDIRHVLEVVLLDAFELDNSVARGRLLVAIAQTAARLLETGEYDERLAALERAAATGPDPRPVDPLLDDDDDEDEGESDGEVVA